MNDLSLAPSRFAAPCHIPRCATKSLPVGKDPPSQPCILDMLRGPLYFYWSPGRNRIACSIH
jgi:hypothetical protein